MVKPDRRVIEKNLRIAFIKAKEGPKPRVGTPYANPLECVPRVESQYVSASNDETVVDDSFSFDSKGSNTYSYEHIVKCDTCGSVVTAKTYVCLEKN